MIIRNSLVAQWLKDPALSLQWLGLLLCHGFNPWPRNLHVAGMAREKVTLKKGGFGFACFFLMIISIVIKSDGNNNFKSESSGQFLFTCILSLYICFSLYMYVCVCNTYIYIYISVNLFKLQRPRNYPTAKYTCKLCDVLIESIAFAHKHIKEKRHKKNIKVSLM